MTPLGLQRLLTVPPVLLLIAHLASADAITGRVVDANGVGVAGVDIDLISLGGGGNPHEANDGTDANGNFTTTVDPGVYEVRFYAPAPPASTLLTGVVTPVVVTGTKNMGTITLTAGVALTAAVRNAANLPVSNVRCNVFDATTGAQYHLKNNLTNAFGNLSITIPNNTPLRLEVLTNLVVGQVLVPRRITLTASGATNLGNVVLDTGFHVTGTVKTQAGTPIAGANVDMVDSVTGVKLFTPGDNTTSLGLFDVVVPAGTYDLDVARPSTLVLVGYGINNLVVTAATNVGILTLRNGVFLSGTVRNHRGQPVLAADVNVYEVSTGLSLSLDSDNTNAAGFYSVVVPLTTIDVVFSPPGQPSILAKDRHNGITITTATVLDGQLPAPAPFYLAPAPGTPPGTKPVVLPFGTGTSGSNGVPHLRATRGANGGLLLLATSGRPGAPAELLLGARVSTLDRLGVHQLVRPDLRLALRLDAHGEASFPLPVTNATLSGLATNAQLAVRDPAAHFGVALSHVLAVALP